MDPPVPLDPCIGYREQLLDAASYRVVATEMHLLNCTTLPVIASGADADFEMQMDVPPGLPSGDSLTLDWETVLGQVAYGDLPVVID